MQSNSGHHPTPLFWYLGFHGNAILNFINTPKASTHYAEHSYNVSWSLLKEINFFFKSPFFLFPWQRQPFWKNQPYTAQLHMAYDIPTRFHKVWSRHLREIERTKMCGRIIIIIIIIIVKKKRRIAIHHPTTVWVM